MGLTRILGEDGKFHPYKGPKPQKAVIKSPEQKVAERKALDTVAASAGFKTENPVAGGLSKADKAALNSGSMAILDIITLASVREIPIPKELGADVDKIVAFLLGDAAVPAGGAGLSEEDKEKVRAGISIPEMKKLAKDRGVVVPKEVRKAVDIKAFLLKDDEKDEDSL